MSMEVDTMGKKKIQAKESETKPTSTGLEETVPETAHGRGRIQSIRQVNVMVKPWSSSLRAGVAQYGDPVAILSKDGIYWRIRTLDGTEGYVHSQFIEEVPYG